MMMQKKESRTLTRLFVLVALMTMTLGTTACGGGDDQVVDDQVPTTGPATPQTYEVVLFNYRFNPNTVTIPRGTTVVFRNKDAEKHNISIPALNIDQQIAQNGTWQYTFNTAGEFAVSNKFTDSPMRATIVVQ